MLGTACDAKGAQAVAVWECLSCSHIMLFAQGVVSSQCNTSDGVAAYHAVLSVYNGRQPCRAVAVVPYDERRGVVQRQPSAAGSRAKR